MLGVFLISCICQSLSFGQKYCLQWIRLNYYVLLGICLKGNMSFWACNFVVLFGRQQITAVLDGGLLCHR